MKRRNLFGLAAALTVATALTGPLAAQETLKIGAVGPKTARWPGAARSRSGRTCSFGRTT